MSSASSSSVKEQQKTKLLQGDSGGPSDESDLANRDGGAETGGSTNQESKHSSDSARNGGTKMLEISLTIQKYLSICGSDEELEEKEEDEDYGKNDGGATNSEEMLLNLNADGPHNSGEDQGRTNKNTKKAKIEKVRTMSKWEEAALYVQEGEDNTKFYQHPNSYWSKLAYGALHYPAYHILHLIVAVLLLLLAMAEFPAVGGNELNSESKKILLSINELEMIRDQCSKDARRIDLELSTVKKRMDKITSDYKKEEGDKQKRLSSNRKEQEELRQKLSQLEREEEKLQEELSLGQSQEQEACDAKKEVMSDVEGWRGKIVELQGRSETSLKVMKVMSDVTELVITDAQKKQVSCREKMNKLELESLLSKRDVLMAQGGMYKLIDFETQRNITNLESELAELEKDKKSAARANFRMKVERITQNIESYAAEKTKFVEKCQDAQSRLTGITADLNAMDTRLRSLDPHLKLDKLDQRYSARKTAMDKAFADENPEKVEFSSRGNYQHL